MTAVVIDYAPRPQQLEIHRLIDTHRFVVLVCHRRFGKTVLGVNHLIRSSLTCKRQRPRFGYLAPTYTQGKATAFDYFKHYSNDIPGRTVNQSELRVDMPNQGQVRIYGADNPDSLRGLYFDGVDLDEYGLHQAKTYSEVIAPTLVDRGGWALFKGTPNGRNQFYEIAEHAKKRQAAGDKDWAFAEYKASQTGLLDEVYLAAARSQMTADEYAQEFECSFEAAVKGAIYAREMEATREQKRITRVPFDPVLPVDTDWDIGYGDATAIWFSQSLKSGEVRVIDYYEASGEGLPHYAQVLKRREVERGYVYGSHWAPWDFAAMSFETGKSRMDAAREHGFAFKQCPRLARSEEGEVEEGINAVRMLFPRCWFDAERCNAGLEALMHYRRDYNQRLNEFKATPVHDWASHGADAFRGLAVRHKVPMDKKEVVMRMPTEYAWS